MIDKMGCALTNQRSVGGGYMKGHGMFFIVFGLIGVLLGLFLISHGLGGNGLSAPFVLAVGIFIAVKELLDIMH